MNGSRSSTASLGGASLALLLAACAGGDERAAGDTGAVAAPAATDSAAASMAGDTGAAGGRWMALVDPGTATREELARVPGLDSAAASALVAGRPYADMRAVDRVLAPRLSETQRDSVYAYVFTPIDLNTASDEEILLIPGIGPRMLREFKEYRPYRSMAQFRREIGKYVDDREVERLARYVSVPGAQQ